MAFPRTMLFRSVLFSTIRSRIFLANTEFVEFIRVYHVVRQAPYSPDIRRYRQRNLSQVRCSCRFVIFLTMKLRRDHLNTPFHQLTLLTGGKHSRMRMKLQGRLMQANFIYIQQVFANTKIRSDTFVRMLHTYKYTHVHENIQTTYQGVDPTQIYGE